MPRDNITANVAAEDKVTDKLVAAKVQAKILEITALIARSDEDLCEEHPDATELAVPDECQIAVWSEPRGEWLTCLREARWVLDNDRFDAPAIKGCPAGVAGYLRSRLYLDRLAVKRGMA